MCHCNPELRTPCCGMPECFPKTDTAGLNDLQKEQVKRFVEALKRDGAGMALVCDGTNLAHNRKMERLLVQDRLEPTGCVFRDPQTDEMTILERGAVRRIYKRQALHLMHGAQPGEKPHPLIKFFDHREQPEHQQEISRPICELAYFMDNMLVDSPEKTEGLRKLLEAKDCLLRAC